MTSGASATNSAAYLRMRSASPAPQRVSIRTLRPSVQPSCCSPCTNAAMRRLQFRIVRGQVQEHADAPHPLGLLRARRERPRSRRAAEQRDELAPLYPNHVNPRAYAVRVRLKRALASLAHFARCLGCRPFPPKGGGAMTAELYRATHPRHQGRGGGPPRGATRHHRGGQADDGPAGVLPGHGRVYCFGGASFCPVSSASTPCRAISSRMNLSNFSGVLSAAGTRYCARPAPTVPTAFRHQPQAVKAGDLLFMSAQMAIDGDGLIAVVDDACSAWICICSDVPAAWQSFSMLSMMCAP